MMGIPVVVVVVVNISICYVSNHEVTTKAYLRGKMIESRCVLEDVKQQSIFRFIVGIKNYTINHTKG